ncbi:MAG: Unknown protein [uncultured Aureispira sp.]|uniref:Secretion system C-terminal sorting domain-containing protein n=1 Tax=uncultured Aureispira sp. TaxID=1331704 RepID=A0A6S6S738_9BACT|nr:MAG: Unknown protein [uncultured Aureispira sp.]
MKKFLLSALCAFSTTALVQAQIPQTAVVEHFTQASCAPCASQNPTLYNTLGTFGSANYVKLTYQTSWPGVDPMNAEYPAGPNDRRVYYGVTGVPNASLNGNAVDGPNTIVTASTLAAAAALMTPYEISITQNWTSTTNVDLDIVIRNVTTSPISTADRFHFAMVEENITFAAAPGSNGETDFFNVVRDMYNVSTGASSTAGTTIDTIPAGDSLTFTMSVTPPAYIRDLNQISFVGYVQNNATQVVYQGGKSIAGGVPGLLSVTAAANSTVGAGYCDYNFTPEITFTNNSAIPVTTVTGEYTINGGTAVPVTVGGLNLMSGQSTTIAFPATTLASGTSNVEYSITDVNAGGTYSQGPVTMAPEAYDKLPSVSIGAPIVEGFESAPLIPTTGYSRTLTTGIFEANGASESNFSILDGPTYSYGAIGGMALSNRSVRFRFYNLQASSEISLIMQKVNFGLGSKVTFDHAYRQYQTAEDALDVEVSTDCGATWTSVWNKSGADLATLSDSTAQYTPADSSEWVSDTILLAAYDNTNDVVIRFKGTSDYGNNLYIDNINITSGVVSVNKIQTEAAEVRIMPNPVSNKMALEFTMLNSADANISIINALGQQVQQVTNGYFSGTNLIEVNTSKLASGVYFVNIITEEGTTTKRFVRQ